MDKLIIFCEHGVETLTYFSKQMACVFASWGYEIFWMDMEMTGLGAWKLRQMACGRQAVLITFNFIGLSGEEGLWELDDAGMPQTSIWEKLDILCLNLMVDHPLYYYKVLKHPVPGMKTFCIDRDHAAYMRRFYPEIPCEFLPLAGNLLETGSWAENKIFTDSNRAKSILQTANKEPFGQWLQRPYPVVFTANYVPILNIEKQFQNLEPEYRDFYHEILEAFVQNPRQELFSCIERYLRREMQELDNAGICEAMSTMAAVDLWIRTFFREKTVRILAEGGIRIHVFGKDWDRISCKCPGNLISSGQMTDSASCVRAVAQGKIALNTMPWFKDGAHDRIFTAMLQNTAVLTDDSRYLREEFRDMDTLVYYDLKHLEALPDRVRELLKEPQLLYETACRGRAAAAQFHTWECRARALREYL